jgi:Raf kinase inhibitor-like YbhB/YbcL family protein
MSMRSAAFLFTTIMLIAAAAVAWRQAGTFQITSPAFTTGSTIAEKYSCTGENVSPPLRWSGVPDAAKTLALVMDDPGAPRGTFTHWVVYNLPPSSSGVDGAQPHEPSLPGGGRQGINSTGTLGYFGPCPPPGPAHHYHFRLFALDTDINLDKATAVAVEDAMRGHIKASAETIGTFAR